MQSTANAQATNMQHELNMQGTHMVATAQAIATATQWQYQIDQQNTAIAQAATNAVLPTHAIWTADAARAQATIQAGEAEKVALAVKRQAMKNGLDAFGPWVLLVVVGGVAAWGYSKFIKTRPHVRDQYGSRPILEREFKGGVVYYLPDLAKSGATAVLDDGTVVDYGPVDQQEFPNVVRRAQAIEAIKSLPSESANTGKQMINVEFGKQGGGRVTIANATAMSPVLDEADRNLVSEVGNV
jgi:hypothetical protein